MLYDPITGKRIKKPYNHINWLHSVIKQPEFELKQCFFGEHLINQFKSKPIAIVESEKTAVIASVYLPEFVWLAVGSLTNFNLEKCSVLVGKSVVLFPDLNGFEKWTIKAHQLSYLANISVSDLLERKATETEKKQGLDLADYLIRFDYKDFILNKSSPPQNEKQPLVEVETIIQSLSENWEQEIKEIEIYFANINIPTEPVKLNNSSIIADCDLFINSHINIVKKHKGNMTFLPFIERLNELKQVLKHS
jgi:hypothetical protein